MAVLARNPARQTFVDWFADTAGMVASGYSLDELPHIIYETMCAEEDPDYNEGYIIKKAHFVEGSGDVILEKYKRGVFH